MHDVETYETMRELLHMRRIIGTGEEDGKKFSLAIFSAAVEKQLVIW